MISVRHPKDFWAGVLFLLLGGAAMWLARGYMFGSAARMGPGYFPTVLGGLLSFLGLILAGRGLVVDGRAVMRFHWRPLLLILGSVILFGWGLPHFGLVLSIFVLVIVSAFAGHDFRPREVALLAVVLGAGSVAVFVFGLKLQFPVWPKWI